MSSREVFVKPTSGAYSEANNFSRRHNKGSYDMPALPESKQETRIPSFDKTTDSS